MNDELIAHALHLAKTGTQEDDGYIYQVSSKELADYSQTIRALVTELENARTTIEEDAIYMRRVEGFHQWFEDTYLHSGHIATLWRAYLRSGEVV